MTARPLLCILATAAAALALAASASAAFPGPNGRIAFTSTRDGTSTYEIYSAAPDGSDAKRLTWGDAAKQNPTWSPDGSKIAYEDAADGRFKIYVMSHDGSGRTRVSPDTASSIVDDTNPAWSPDGTRIAFASTRPSGDAWHVWVVNADGTDLRRLTDGFGVEPAWSPDGSRIAYEWDGRIQVVNVDGSGAHPITAPSGLYDEGPDWSPDGGTIAFSRRTFDGSSSELYAVGPDGSGLRRLTSGGVDYRPAWSPDGTKIAFQRRDGVTGSFQLFTMAAGGGVARLMESLRDDLGPDWGQSTVSPIPSPPDSPLIQIFSPTEGAVYLPGRGDPAIYFCSSEISFVISCDGDVPLGEPVDTSSYGTKRFTVTATDVEGRQSQASVTYTVLDLSGPRIDITSPANGAEYVQGADVSVAFSCDDGPGGSGVSVCVGDLEPGSRIDTSRVGTYTLHAFALDNAGNSSSASATYRVLDRTPPSISIATPAAGAVYTQGQNVLADYSCTDEAGGSGVESCAGDAAAGAPIDTSTVGERTFTVRAADRSGNSSTASRSYTVVFDFQGFFAPVAAYPTPTSMTAGEAVPLKFSLHGDQGTNVLAAGSPKWAYCTSSAETAPASGTLSYNASADRYIYLAATQKAWAGSCRDLVVTLRDGGVHRARIAFRK